MASKAEAHPGQKKEAHKDSERDKYGKSGCECLGFLLGPWATEPQCLHG